AVSTASRRLIYEVTLTADQGNFSFGAAALPDSARASLDEMINRLKADPQGVFIEIEGHTDNTGPNELNEQLGLERAESVKRYLYEQHQVPLHKINVISYGEEKPVAPNNTREGRAQNRRVVVRVLS
ncbi:MAG: OmpA family protein, partial [Acidobacteria bacterium]|nr:OmpA family protein [Acidobacteriota bacterium]